MVHIAADLPQFLQRRELAAYEQRLARTAYAYGADLRRAQWLAMSTLGDPLMRSVDRRWSRLVHDLEADSLRPLSQAPPTALLETLARLIHMLRAPLPSLRVLRRDVAAGWPIATPLGTTKGGIHWLVVDLDRLMALDDGTRIFVLAAALGHLQCDHGPIFAAHLMAHRGGRLGLVKGLMRPWAKVSVFSADRAGMLAARSLEVALQGVALQDQAHPDWLPRWPSVEIRRAALEDFDRCALMARRRLLGDADEDWAVAPPGREEEIDSLTRRLGAAMETATRWRYVLATRFRPNPLEDAQNEAEPEQAEQAEQGQAQAQGERAQAEATPQASSSKGAAAAEPSAPSPDAAVDPERASRLEQALRDAWTLARCDARLTRRLKLL